MINKILNKIKKSGTSCGPSEDSLINISGLDSRKIKEEILEKLRSGKSGRQPDAGEEPGLSAKARDILAMLKSRSGITIMTGDEPSSDTSSAHDTEDDAIPVQNGQSTLSIGPDDGLVSDVKIEGTSPLVEKRLQEALEKIKEISEKKNNEITKSQQFIKISRELDSERERLKKYKDDFESLNTKFKNLTIAYNENIRLSERLNKELEERDKRLSYNEKVLGNTRRELNLSIDKLKARDDKTEENTRISLTLNKAMADIEEGKSRLEILKSDYEKSKETTSGLLLKNEESLAEIRKKDREIEALNKRVLKMGGLEEALKKANERLSGLEALSGEVNELKKENDSYRDQAAVLNEEIKSLRVKNTEISGINSKLSAELSGKDLYIKDIEKKFLEETENVKRERDRIFSNVEGLRSKLYTATKESREFLSKVNQLEEVSRVKDKKIFELEKALTDALDHKVRLEDNLKSAENQNKIFTDKLLKVENELTGHLARYEELSGAYKSIERDRDELNVKFEANLRGKKDVEKINEELCLKLDEKTSRLEASDKTRSELEARINDMIPRLEDAERAGKELSSLNKELSLNLNNLQAEKDGADKRVKELSADLSDKTARLQEYDKRHKDMEEVMKGLADKIAVMEAACDDGEREVSRLNTAITALRDELKATEDAASFEIGRLAQEIVSLKDNTVKYKNRESEYKCSIERLNAEVQSRDVKIGTDLKYIERLIKEASELRKKAKQPRG